MAQSTSAQSPEVPEDVHSYARPLEVQMALSPRDPYSHSRPDQIAVTSTTLRLSVNFQQNVLEGHALITIAKHDLGCDKLILDTYGLEITSVNYCYCGATENLHYHLENECSMFGRKLTITIPNMYEIAPPTTAKRARTTYSDDLTKFIIEIKYNTSPNSPAFYWLKPEQTSNGTHHLLISNTKLTYARAIFPCQDTPSHKYQFCLEISVPKPELPNPEYTVLMHTTRHTGITKISKNEDPRTIYKSQGCIPSYAMYIIVGSLEKFKIKSTRPYLIFNLWAERRYMQQSIMALQKCIPMRRTLKNLYDFTGVCNVCVLPPNVPEFDMQCPSMTFLSSTLLTNQNFVKDRLHQSMKNTILQNILESWIATRITIENFQHLWLIKSFSKFICRDCTNEIVDREVQRVLEIKSFNNLQNMLQHPDISGLVLNPGVLPKNMINYVSEKGYLFLNWLQNKLDDPGDLIRFVQHFLANCLSETESLTTDQFKTDLCGYFAGEAFNIAVLNSVHWDEWFYTPGLPSDYNRRQEPNCHGVAQYWINRSEPEFGLFRNIHLENDIIKIEILRYLHAHASPEVLTRGKLKIIRIAINEDLECNNCELKFHWFRLCFKSKEAGQSAVERSAGEQSAKEALYFARELYAKYACPIFRDIYTQTETRQVAHEELNNDTKRREFISKMLPETREELVGLDPIFNVRENS